MSSLQKIDSIAIIIMSILGAVFFLMASFVFKNLDANCPSSALRNGWAFIQALGACMLVAGVSYFVCVLFGGNCYSSADSVRTIEVYFGIFAFFCLLIVGLCGGMLKEYSNLSPTDKNNCDDGKNTTKRSIMFVTVISGLGLLGSIGFFIKVHFEEKNIV